MRALRWVVLAVLLSHVVACGTERWPVKVGNDPDAPQVNMNPTTGSISTLVRIPTPQQNADGSRLPGEFQTKTLKTTLEGFKSESDQDYHLVLKDSSGNTMIAEIPNPDCVGDNSPFKKYVIAARNAFDSQFPTVSSRFQTVNQPVIITGVVFFDFLHGQTGVAPNGVELHPVLNIQFTGSKHSALALNSTESADSESEADHAREQVAHEILRQQRYRGARRVPGNMYDRAHDRVGH